MSDDSNNGQSRRSFLKGAGGIALAAGIAGCSGLGSREYRATPAGLSEEGMRAAGFSLASMDTSTVATRDMDVPGGGLVEAEVTSHVATYRMGSVDGEGANDASESGAAALTPTWAVRNDRARAFGVVSMPAVSVGGQSLNPLARQPLSAILTSERGRDLLARTGAVPDGRIEWTSEPERIGETRASLLGEQTAVKSYAGVVSGGDDGTGLSVLAHLARVRQDGDVVLAGFVQWRSASPGSAAADAPTPAPSNERLETMQGTVSTAVGNVVPNPALESAIQIPMVSLRDVRLVQRSDETRVVDDSGQTRQVLHEEPNPPVVVGDQTGVVFETRTSALDEMPYGSQLDVHVTVWDGNGLWSADTLSLYHYELDRLDSGDASPAGLLSRLPARRRAGIPVFAFADEIERITVNVQSPEAVGDTVTLQKGRDFETETLRPLRLGFVEVIDPDGGANFGDENGRVEQYATTVESTTDYIQRVFPGDVTAYRMDRPLQGARDTSKYAEAITYTDAKIELNRAATRVFQNRLLDEGTMVRAAPDRQTAVGDLRHHGFDVVVAVLPEGYYSYHNAGNLAGFAPARKSQSVSMLGIRELGGPDAEFQVATGAQEVAHRLVGRPYQTPPSCHPMGQRDGEKFDKQVSGTDCAGEPVDFDHARHAGSTRLDSSTDEPGVVSIPLDLSGGEFRMLRDLAAWGGGNVTYEYETASSDPVEMPSYMSYSGEDTWADARVTRRLIADGFDVHTGGGGGQSTDDGDDDALVPVVAIAGGVTPDGAVDVGSLYVFGGRPLNPADPQGTDPGATVTLHDPAGERLEQVRVPTVDDATHRDPREGVVSFTLALPDRATTLRIDHQGQTTDVALLTDPLRIALDRLSEGRLGPSARTELDAALGEVAEAVSTGAFESAGETLRTRVRPELDAGISGTPAHLGDPSRASLDALVTRLADRAARLAGA